MVLDPRISRAGDCYTSVEAWQATRPRRFDSGPTFCEGSSAVLGGWPQVPRPMLRVLNRLIGTPSDQHDCAGESVYYAAQRRAVCRAIMLGAVPGKLGIRLLSPLFCYSAFGAHVR